MEYVLPIKSKSDIKRFKNYFLKQNYRNYFLFTLGINIGFRPSDLVKLKVIDVKDKESIFIRADKTGKLIRMPIIVELRELIDQYIEDMDENDYLFSSNKCKGKHIRADRLYILMSTAGKDLGIEHIGSHSLRKTFGYHYYKRTNDVATLQELFGHASQRVTLRYIGIDLDYMRESMKGGFL